MTTDRNARRALAAFATIELSAFVFLVWIGRSIWFATDEWDWVAARRVGDLGDLFRPHNEHWSTPPILVYRALWALFGLHTHLPYQVIVVALHLTVAALLLVVMRRAGVRPWIATITASVFVLFGAGYLNIEYAFQMAWGMSLVFGLAHLLLADHDGPVDRRDWVGLGFGLAGVMSSGPGVVMTLVVAVAVLLRHGWRRALLHAAPLAIVFVVWWAIIGRETYGRHTGPGEALRFMGAKLWATLRAIGDVPGAGLALSALLLVGAVLLGATTRREGPNKRLAAPAALLIGAPVFLFTTGIGRAGQVMFGNPSTDTSRYLHVAAAMVLPAVAVAADAVVTRWKLLAPAVAAVLVIGIPGNVRAMVDNTDKLVTQTRSQRNNILALPRNPIAKDVPRSLRPQLFAPDLTMGWLLDGVRAGRIPAAQPLTPEELATQTLILALERSASARPTPCRRLRGETLRVLRKGEALRVESGRLEARYVADDGSQSVTTQLRGPAVVARVEGVRLRLIVRSPITNPVVLCG